MNIERLLGWGVVWVALMSAAPAQTTYTWISPVTSQFQNAENWAPSEGAPPSAEDSISLVSGASAVEIQITNAAPIQTVHNVFFSGNSSDVTIVGTQDTGPYRSLTVAGTLFKTGSAIFRLRSNTATQRLVVDINEVEMSQGTLALGGGGILHSRL